MNMLITWTTAPQPLAMSTSLWKPFDGTMRPSSSSSTAGRVESATHSHCPLFGCYEVENGHHRLIPSFSAFDPKRPKHDPDLRPQAPPAAPLPRACAPY